MAGVGDGSIQVYIFCEISLLPYHYEFKLFLDMFSYLHTVSSVALDHKSWMG